MSTTLTTQTQKAASTETFVQPYLDFAGRCEEALKFYEKAIGAQIDVVMRFDESPDPVPEGLLEPGFEKKVMHSQFRVGSSTIMATDGCDSKSKFQGFQLSISVPTEQDADRVFAALSDGGKVSMPLCKTFWSPRFGMLQDRFGVSWMVIVPNPNHR